MLTLGVFCGGSLINDRYILTAGHCLAPKDTRNLKVALGVHDFSQLRDAQIIRPKEFIIHKLYDIQSIHQKWDIALIKMKTRVKFSTEINPVCLPSANFTDDFNNLFVAGWGKLNDDREQSLRLLEVSTPQKNIAECITLLGKHRVTNNHLCAGTPEKDSCEGDSGGPLMTRYYGAIYQVGVVSWGMSCGHEKYPGVYTKVRSYLDWILENTKGAKWCKPYKSKTNRN